ncbi:hypothetical protein C8J56DRAFT_342619 [Mycena floridula]|nr:hypothetical protein C8J56DRAFT_342619 [Mycena floridula]
MLTALQSMCVGIVLFSFLLVCLGLVVRSFVRSRFVMLGRWCFVLSLVFFVVPLQCRFVFIFFSFLSFLCVSVWDPFSSLSNMLLTHVTAYRPSLHFFYFLLPTCILDAPADMVHDARILLPAVPVGVFGGLSEL